MSTGPRTSLANALDIAANVVAVLGPRSDAAQAVYEAAHEAWVKKDDPSSIAAAALCAAAAQMIKTDDLADTMEDVIRGAERHHQAGGLHTIATELEGANG